jgi:hypothetical protein
MTLNQATYALLQSPSFDVIPDTDVVLGSIHPRTKTKPRRPDTKLILNRSNRIAIPPAVFRSRTDPILCLDSESLRSGGAGIKAYLPYISSVGGEISGKASSESVVYIVAENVETQWFVPDRAYLEQAIEGVAVKQQLLDFRRPSVFLVTGVKIAERATIITGSTQKNGGEVGLQVDLTQFGVPIEVGASIKAKCKDCRTVVVQKSRCVIAFETRRVRKKQNGYNEEAFNDFAFLDAGRPGLSKTSLDQFDFKEVAHEIGDE